MDAAGARPHCPPVNITMPVWNRMDLTLHCILSVAEKTSTPYCLTVVDNGSDAALRTELLDLHGREIIHNLYFLDTNYGVSCACNTGWKLHPAAFCMKLDNDMEILSPTWLQHIFQLWGKKRYDTVMGPVWNCAQGQGRVDTAWGTYWPLPVSLSGAALLVSAKVLEHIGYFSEDYGLYGEEDADYCMRCHHAGIRKYTFECAPLIRHCGTDDAEYLTRDLNKRALHQSNVGDARRRGLFALNLFLYAHGLRPLKVPPRYTVAAVRGHDVALCQDPHYAAGQDRLAACLDVYNDAALDEQGKVDRMTRLLQDA